MLRIIAAVVALSAASTARAEGRWVEAYDQGNAVMYVDEKTLRTIGSKTLAWTHVESAEADGDGDHGLTALYEFDCAAGTARLLEATSYSEPDRGLVRNRVKIAGSADRPLPASRGELMYEFVCDLVSGKPWTTYRVRWDNTAKPNGKVD